MAYTPTTWKNREVERPRTYTMQENGDGTVTLIPAEGTIIEGGTPIVAENMNKIETGIVDLEKKVDDDKEILNNAQLTKITSDTGGQKMTLHDTSKSVLNEIVALGTGMHTFYAASGVLDMPVPRSVRGVAHFTSPTFGWLQCQDYLGGMYTNYYDNGTWRGWKTLFTEEQNLNYKHYQTELWSGMQYLSATQVVYPTKKLTECKNGWALLFSDYNTGEPERNVDFFWYFVPRGSATYSNGHHLLMIPSYNSSVDAERVWAMKTMYIYDNKIEGHVNNDATATGKDVVLRKVIEI